MFKHIRMKNFKSWKDSGEVKLAPLTGFFGTNSSGKSSLLQMLLLLKQTVDSDEFIFFGDENSLVNLGNFAEVIHNHEKKEELELECGYIPWDPSLIDEIIPTDEVVIATDPAHQKFTFNMGLQLNWLSNRGAFQNYDLNYYYPFSNSGTVSVVSVNLTDPASQMKKCYGVGIDDKCFNNRRLDFVKMKTLAREFESLFDHVFFLGPTRVHPQRNFRWVGTHPKNVGHFGDKTIDALLSSRIDQLTTPFKEQRVPIEERISAWFQEMDLAYSFSLERTEQDYEVRIQRSPDSAEVTLTDMGYGLSQFLPVLVLCYYAPEYSTLILEQPGMHLHPKVQSQLADLLIEVVTERNLQVLVESHSEHLLNRLQRRVAEEKIDADQTAVYFCQNDKGVSTIEHLEMDKLGNIKNWPPNFFGDEMGDLFAMTEAQMERQKKMEDE